MEKRKGHAGRRLWKKDRSSPAGGYGKEKGARRKAAMERQPRKKGRARQEPVEMEMAQQKGAFYAL